MVEDKQNATFLTRQIDLSVKIIDNCGSEQVPIHHIVN